MVLVITPNKNEHLVIYNFVQLKQNKMMIMLVIFLLLIFMVCLPLHVFHLLFLIFSFIISLILSPLDYLPSLSIACIH